MTGQSKQEMAGRQSAAGSASLRQARDLQTLSRRSLWEVLLFILLSIVALQLRDSNLLQAVPENLRSYLGYPPSATLVSSALAVYSFSAAFILLNRLADHTEPQPKWSHLGYRSMFYFFYALSGSLANHFLAVFFIGFFLYGAEQVHIWIYGSRVEHQEKELLGEQ